MELSERARQFLDALDPESLQVGDGSDGRPVWVGVDAEAGRVYKVYATGLATGFGDGRMAIMNGLKLSSQAVAQGEQFTQGRHVSLFSDGGGQFFECDPGPALSPAEMDRRNAEISRLRWAMSTYSKG